jgi:polyadenylate-binding protein
MATGDKKSVKVGHQLFVKNLPRHWTHEELFNQFTKFGTVVSSKVSIDGNYVSRGYGFVEMDSEVTAQKAITELNNQLIQVEEEPSERDFKLAVCEYVPRLDRPGLGKPRCSTNLYVKNFPTQEGRDFTDD